MKSKTSNFIQFFTVCLAPALVGLSLPSAHAASATWDAGGGTNNLINSANWSGDVSPTASGDIATWDGTVPGDLVLTWSSGFGSSPLGTKVEITAAQTSNLLIGSSSTLAPTVFNGDNFNFGDLTIASGAGAFTFGDGVGNDNTVFRNNGSPLINLLTNNSSNTATFASNVYFNSGTGNPRTFIFDGSGNWQVNTLLRFSNESPMTIIKNGEGTLSLGGSVSSGGASTSTYIINAGILKVTGSGLLGDATHTGNLTNEAAFSYESSATQTIPGIISGGGTFTQTAGTLILTGKNTYTGPTLITGGTLNVSGDGYIDLSSGVTVNGPTARYLHTSTSPSFLQGIALTQGTVAGTGTISAVTVADNTNAIVANGNGNSAALTIDALTFNGDATLSVTDDGDKSTPGIIVTGALSTTPANGTVTVNASNSFWNSGVTYNLVSSGTIGPISNFTKGAITGLTGRQTSSLVLNGSTLGLLIGGDNPKWSGLDSSNWVVGNTGTKGNWAMIAGGGKTDYVQGDVVLFDDSPTNTTVTISAANVSPAVVNFNNTKSYTINGAFGIAAGAVNKNGTGTVTISTANTYNGGTTVNAGKLAFSGAGTLGSGFLAMADGSVNLGGTSQTVGSLTISGQAVIENGTLTATGLTASNVSGPAVISSGLNLGSGNLAKSGEGTLTLSGATAYSGTTTISGGTLALGGVGSLGTTSGVALGGGSLDLGGNSIGSGPITLSSPSIAGDTITNGTISPTGLNYTATSGVATVSANIAGSGGITATGTANVSGTLSLTGANTFTGPLSFTGPATVTITGGSNTGGGAIAFNSFSSNLTMTGGSYQTSGVTSSGNSSSRSLNLNGGELTSAGNIFADNLAIQVAFNGTTLKSTNAAGITVFDFDNTIPVFGIAATFDTTVGDITIGNNTNASVGTNPPRITGVGTGTVTIKGGHGFASGFQYTGILDIQDNSTWNLNGIASTLGGLSGGGSVISSPGAAVLTLNVISGPKTYSGNIATGGNLTVVKQGTETQTLSGTGTFNADFTLTEGTLDITSNSTNTFGNSSTISIVTGAVLNLPNNAVDQVASLVINGTPLAPKTYDASSPETAGLITGLGKIQVVPLTGFAGWIKQFTTLSAAQQLPGADPDFDGIPNLVEYAIAGQDPTAPNPSVGTFSGNTLSFTKRADTSGLTYSIVKSADLGITDPWTEVTGASYVNNATTISYTLTPGTPVKELHPPQGCAKLIIYSFQENQLHG